MHFRDLAKPKMEFSDELFIKNIHLYVTNFAIRVVILHNNNEHYHSITQHYDNARLLSPCR